MFRLGRIGRAAAVSIATMATVAPSSAPAQTPPPPRTAAAAAETDDGARQEARRKRLDALRAALQGGDRAARLAAFEAALADGDPVLRKMAVETAFDGGDPALINLALRDWLSRTKQTPVQLFATKEDPGSVAALQNMGPLTLRIHDFNPAAGAVSGNLGAPGYDVTRDGAAAGTLAQTTLIINTFGCQLALRLSEQRMLDGLYRCRSLPALLARIAPD